MMKIVKYLVAFGILTFTIIPLLQLTQFVHPVTDDFGFSMSKNIWQDTWDIYTTMDNRLVGNFLTILLSNANNISFYRIELFIFIILFFNSIYLLLHTINKYFLYSSTPNLLLFFCFFTFIFISYNPGISEVFYWQPGFVIWTLSIVFFNILITLIIEYYHSNNKYLFTSICILLFIMVSQNEIMFLFIGVFSLFLVYNLFTRVNFIYRKESIIILFVVILGGSIVVFGPGNYIRIKYISTEQAVTTKHLLIYNFLLIRKILFLYPTVIYNILFIPFYYVFSIKISKYVNPFKLFIFSLCVLFLMILPSLIARTLYTFRIQSVVYYFTLILLSLNFINLTIYLRVSKYFRLTELRYTSLVTLIYIISYTILQKESTIKTVYVDLIYNKASYYNEELIERQQFIQTSTSDTIYVNPLVNRPKSIYIGDITNDATDWRNTLYSTFYNKKVIVLNQ